MFGIAVRRLALAAVAGLVVAGGAVGGPATAAPKPSGVGGRPVLDVRDYGAVGDGTTNDSPAVDRAIAAANAAGGAVVRFPAGTYLAGGSIHMMSEVTLWLEAGATLLGAPTGYDVPEPNPNDMFQDFGHSHFHDAMIWGDSLRNIGFVGDGVIDGGGHFITGNPRPGQADKLISLTRCDGLLVGSGLTLRRGGHFAMLINGCANVFSDRLTIDTASDRDGWNVINTRNVLITNANIAANDDALAFKSDWALGATLSNGNVVVRNANLSARCCNALMFGSETCGDFTHYRFSQITITGAGKSGLGMVSMDGANISDVRYNDITIAGTAGFIMEKVGTRRRCGGTPGVGSIRDIHYTNITGMNAGVFSPTLWGQPGHEISDVTFKNVRLTSPGGRPPMDPNAVPSDNGDYNPNGLGTRPAYGFYLHNVDGIRFEDSTFDLAADDGRPAVIANAGRAVTLRRVTVQRGTASPFDVGFQSVAGYCLREAATTAKLAFRLRAASPGGPGTLGRPPRLSTPDSAPASRACTAGLDNFSLGTQPAGQTGTAGGTVRFSVPTSIASGRPERVTLTATGLPAGAQTSFSPNPVRPGRTATMTVTTAPDTRNRTFPLTVVGTNATATQYARAALTVTGGVDLTVTDLTVADPDNAADWSVQSNLQPNATLFGDRTFTLPSIPEELIGSPWIRTANDSKTATADPLATFTISAPATVAVAVDTRLGRRPWMDASWVDTGLQLSAFEGGTTFRRFQVYEKAYPAGAVSLGPAAAGTVSTNMYTVIVL